MPNVDSSSINSRTSSPMPPSPTVSDLDFLSENSNIDSGLDADAVSKSDSEEDTSATSAKAETIPHSPTDLSLKPLPPLPPPSPSGPPSEDPSAKIHSLKRFCETVSAASVASQKLSSIANEHNNTFARVPFAHSEFTDSFAQAQGCWRNMSAKAQDTLFGLAEGRASSLDPGVWSKEDEETYGKVYTDWWEMQSKAVEAGMRVDI